MSVPSRTLCATLKSWKWGYLVFDKERLEPRELTVLFNISRDILYSVFYLFTCKPYDIITLLICIIQKCQYLQNEKKYIQKWKMRFFHVVKINNQQLFFMSYTLWVNVKWSHFKWKVGWIIILKKRLSKMADCLTARITVYFIDLNKLFLVVNFSDYSPTEKRCCLLECLCLFIGNLYGQSAKTN